MVLLTFYKGARSGNRPPLAHSALAPGGDSGAVPTAMAIERGQNGHSKRTPVPLNLRLSGMYFNGVPAWCAAEGGMVLEPLTGVSRQTKPSPGGPRGRLLPIRSSS